MITLLLIFFVLLSMLSIVVNVTLLWYNREAVKKIVFFSDNIGDMMGFFKEFLTHLETLYEMEVFYGDETIKGLIDHTKFMVGEISNFEEIYSLTREEETMNDGANGADPQAQEEAPQA